MNRFPSYLRVTLLATLLATFWLANIPEVSARATPAPGKQWGREMLLLLIVNPALLAALTPSSKDELRPFDKGINSIPGAL